MSDAERRALADDADLCVKCGLCLPSCPTYRLSEDENESPRGRIALIEAWARDALPADAALRAHVDRCLLCRACETMCPAKVPYASLVDRFRAATRPAHRAWLDHGLDLGLRLAGRIRRIPEVFPAHGAVRAEVSLFAGCTGASLDRETLEDAVFVLNRLGVTVRIPKGYHCCGALEQHAGNPARALEKQREAAWAYAGDAPIVYLASGCGTHLAESRPFASSGARVVEFCVFLESMLDTVGAGFQCQVRRALLHVPCTLRGAEGATIRVLRQIPGLEVETVDWADCCGAAGRFMLEHPQLARQLREPLVERVRASGADVLLTSNIGCMLHLKSGLSGFDVLHPARVLAQSLGKAPHSSRHGESTARDARG